MEGQPLGGGLRQTANILLGVVEGLLPGALRVGVGTGDDELGLGLGLIQLLLDGLLEGLL